MMADLSQWNRQRWSSLQNWDAVLWWDHSSNFWKLPHSWRASKAWWDFSSPEPSLWLLLGPLPSVQVEPPNLRRLEIPSEVWVGKWKIFAKSSAFAVKLNTGILNSYRELKNTLLVLLGASQDYAKGSAGSVDYCSFSRQGLKEQINSFKWILMNLIALFFKLN